MTLLPLDSSRVIKTLCDHQGCLDFKTLHEIIATLPDGDSLLQSVLSDDSKVVIQRGTLEATGGQIISPDSLVLAKTSLGVCWKYSRACQCASLHLCQDYIRGNCSSGDNCNNTHSLAEPYNAALLKKHGLQDLTEKQLFQLLLQNDPKLLPEICPHYNKGKGLHGSCMFGTTCNNLHACQHYFQGDCKFGTSCRRAHNIHAQGVTVCLGFSQENIQNLHGIYRNKFIIMSLLGTPVSVLPGAGICAQQPSHNNSGSSSGRQSELTSGADNNEICLHFIQNCCMFKEQCRNVHWHLPYKWQFLDTDDKTWKDLTYMEEIEEAYCDPGHDTSPSPLLPSSLHSSAFPVAQAVNFMTMTYEGSPVRRLSTASSVSKPPHFILTTQWLWYWKDETGKWLEFGQGDSDTPASVTSRTLEKVYLEERDTEIPFSAGNHQCIHFKGTPGTPQMYQENLKYQTKREVRRRPRFVSAHDVKMKVESTSSSTAESFPPNWDKNALPDIGYELVRLPISVEDYRKIETLFKRTMPQRRINSIQRIQNPVLWGKFQTQKKLMKARNGVTDVKELQLFHGTDESLIEAICEQNFDWRMCGVRGTAYGKGSYFARDASYSDRYVSIKKSANKIMFVALVLVGEYCRGSGSYVRPPPKGNSRSFYDSCVDNTSNPSIYVIFEKDQIYPEYIINYS